MAENNKMEKNGTVCCEIDNEIMEMKKDELKDVQKEKTEETVFEDALILTGKQINFPFTSS